MNEESLDGLVQRMDREKKKILNALRSHSLPESLAVAINEQRPDFKRNVFDLFTLEPAVQELFFRLEGLFAPYTDLLIRTVKAYQSFDSAQKVKSFILAELLESKDSYELINQKFEGDGDGYGKLYKTLVGIANLEGVEKQKLKPILESIAFFEEAGLEIILDRDLYFTKTRSGNKGTASEFVGMMVNIPMSNSPIVKDGRYVDRVIQAIKYKDIVEGRLNPEDGQTVGYQQDLLRLLHTVQTPDKPGREYWHRLQRNPAFIDLCHQVAVWDKDPEADNLLCQMVAREWKTANGDLEEFKESMITFKVSNHFYGKTARDKFLAEPANEYKEVMSHELARLRVNFPSEDVYLPGPRIVVITDYVRDGDNTQVGYVEISDGMNSDFNINRKNITLDMKLMQTPGVPEDVGKALLDMATNLESFMSTYHSYHDTAKAKK